MKKIWLLLLSLFILVNPQSVVAAPFFYISGASTASEGNTYTADIYLVSEDNALTAMQTILNFNTSFLTKSSISIVGSRCSFWAPVDPLLGYGNNPTPYFHPTSSSNKAVLACGFSNPGYQSADEDGNLVAKVRFTPNNQGSTSLSFDATNTKFWFIGSQIAAGSMSSFNLTIFESTDSSTPTPAPGSTPTPTPSPGASGSASPTPSPTTTTTVVDPTIYTDDILTFVEIGTGSGGGSDTESEGLVLEVVDEDDTLPAVPSLEPRAKATPFIFSLLGGGGGGGSGESPGDVLAAQSLRELLIPGKSSADKTVVMVNLVSTLTFLALLAIVVWRLITTMRLNQVKAQHMKQYLASELATIESKIASAKTPEGAAQLREELNQAMSKLNESDDKKK